ncbi:MAG: 23S rRNA (uracil(1939)-C(5))-methyltransferase RlmD [Cyanobacteria bacterium J06614_10]
MLPPPSSSDPSNAEQPVHSEPSPSKSTASAPQNPWETAQAKPKWQQGETIKLTITDLSNGGEGVGRWQERVVFVPNTVPGDEMRVQLTKVKETHGFGKPAGIVKASPQRVRPACIVADKCGGCQWQQVSYEAQLAAKHQLVVDALTRIGKLDDVEVGPVIAATETLGYRNKATYPVGRSQTQKVKAGYYQKGSHRLVNLNQCPVQDSRLDPILAGIKQDIQNREWKIYDERTHKGHIRHLSLRIGRRTGQILLTIVSRSVKLKGIHEQAEAWMERYPNIAGVLVNLNWKKTNAIFGPETFSIAGEAYLEEAFAGLTFHIQPTTFFQVNTQQAERLLQQIATELALTGEEVIVDAYCGVGTFTLPLAKQAKYCIGLESFTESVVQAQANAALNQIENVGFRIGDVAALLPGLETTPDIVLLDPPRKGCEPTVLEALIALHPQRIVYVSCNPATLARDLRVLCESGGYHVNRVQPADFFPQTAHVECAVFLTVDAEE